MMSVHQSHAQGCTSEGTPDKGESPYCQDPSFLLLKKTIKTTTQSGVPGVQVKTGNECSGRGSIPDDAGTPGGQTAAGDGSMHPGSRQSADTARH